MTATTTVVVAAVVALVIGTFFNDQLFALAQVTKPLDTVNGEHLLWSFSFKWLYCLLFFKLHFETKGTLSDADSAFVFYHFKCFQCVWDEQREKMAMAMRMRMKGYLKELLVPIKFNAYKSLPSFLIILFYELNWNRNMLYVNQCKIVSRDKMGGEKE